MRQISFALVHSIYYYGHALPLVPLSLVSVSIVILPLLATYKMKCSTMHAQKVIKLPLQSKVPVQQNLQLFLSLHVRGLLLLFL